MKKVEIRDADKETYPLIREQRVNAYSEYADVLPKNHWNALKKAISSSVDENEGAELLVAIVGEKIIGSVALFPAKTNAYEGYVEELDYPEIRMLAVAPEARGQGAAAALITECIRRTKLKGFNAIGLHTGEFMKSAVALYESFGFQHKPQFDFEPANDGIVVRAYQLHFKD